jgi:four helix bundle protein
MLVMETSDWTFKNRPYNLRERLFVFACVITRLVQYLQTRGPVASQISAQLLDSGTSAAANFEEADDGSSTRDRVAKTKIALRELKETRLRLRVLRATGLLSEAHDPVIAENNELVKIVATIIRNSKT